MIVRLPDGRLAYTDDEGFAFIMTGPDEQTLNHSEATLIPLNGSPTKTQPATGTKASRDWAN
ncbi:MAG TPA: hypothetical protein VJ085_06970 [Candidatus Acidoferrales bacterium]|nr:hypothetical protein [Candidatus Acidoferrales bacterium]